MRKAIIVNDVNNESLLRFTQTKCFWDAKNQGLNFFQECTVVESYEQASNIAKNNDVVLEVGDFLTTSFRTQHQNANKVIYAKDQDNVIKFDKQVPIDFKKRYYQQGSKQLYIIENLLKVCIKSSKLVYLDNNESVIISVFDSKYKNFYGLASGWKTMLFATANNFESVTVYDYCERQLKFAQWLHSQSEIPETVFVDPPTSGEYRVTDAVRKNWKKWHNTQVQWKLIDLMSVPRFEQNSVIWTSNVFHYEPTIFQMGYSIVKSKEKQFKEINHSSMIIGSK